MKKAYLIVIATFITVGLLLKIFLKEPSFTDIYEEIYYYQKIDNVKELHRLYNILLKSDSLNIDLHYNYISNYFRLHDKKGKLNHPNLVNYYNNLAYSSIQEINDIGNYCLGLYYSKKSLHNIALDHFQKVNNANLKYLNNSIGYIWLEKKEYEKAVKFFKAEISNKGNINGAYSNLICVYRLTNNLDEIGKLIKNPESKKYLPKGIIRYYSFKKINPIQYIITVLSITYTNIDISGFIAALIIFFIYLLYLRKIDIYEPEKWKYILITFILGIICSEITYFLSDSLNILTGFRINGNIINDFFYCYIGIGAVEEIVKIIPLFILLKFTKEINEPVDYIIYAAVSALGFAFAENILYFSYYGPGIYFGRTLTSVVFHMFLSSLVAYGLVISKYKTKTKTALNFLKYFSLSALIHGIYDFWLINESAKVLSILSIVLFILCLSLFNTMITNSLNNSVFYEKEVKINGNKLQNYLIYSLSGVFIYQLIALSIKIGPAEGFKISLNAFKSGIYLLAFVSANLTNIIIKKGEWNLFHVKFRASIDRGYFDLDSIINNKYELLPFTKNHLLKIYLPNTGTIVKREEFSNEKDWYFIKLDKPINIDDYCRDYILIRPKYREKPISDNKKDFVGVFVFKDYDIFIKENKTRKDIHFLGWAVAKQINS
ncbi:MAG: PrsW family intramembrane metalloprotease [Bacteroidales bacterium]|nr:PrsW family intramembrane metalloprotease [Bacteroidales bacterium]